MEEEKYNVQHDHDYCVLIKKQSQEASVQEPSINSTVKKMLKRPVVDDLINKTSIVKKGLKTAAFFETNLQRKHSTITNILPRRADIANNIPILLNGNVMKERRQVYYLIINILTRSLRYDALMNHSIFKS